MKRSLIISLSLATPFTAFQRPIRSRSSFYPNFMTHEDDSSPDQDMNLHPNVAEKFKILTCSSTSCTSKRKALNMDQYATFAALYSKIQDRSPSVRIEESPCLGACKQAPCVGIEHDDFVGPVSLEGMTPTEFSQRIFQRIVFEEDVDRVWLAVENAIHVMAEQEEQLGMEESDSYV